MGFDHASQEKKQTETEINKQKRAKKSKIADQATVTWSFLDLIFYFSEYTTFAEPYIVYD